MKIKKGPGRPRNLDPQIIIDKAPHRKIQRNNTSNILTIPKYITKLLQIKPFKKIMNNDQSYQPTVLELSYNKTEKSLIITLDKGTKHTYNRDGSQYVIIPMYLAKQYGFTVGSHVAVIADEEKRTIRVILDTPKIIPKTGKAICLAALERVKELETTLAEKESVLKDKNILINSIGYENVYLKQRLKGGTSDPLNEDYWLVPILTKTTNSKYNDKDTIQYLLNQLFYREDWYNSAFFVVWARESYGINKGGLTQHLFNITRPPYDIGKDMEPVKKYVKLASYKEHIESLTKAENQTEIKLILKGQEPASKPVFNLDDLGMAISDDYVRLVKLDTEQSERRKKHRRAPGFTAHAFLDPKKALWETWYNDGRGMGMIIWWLMIGDTIIGSIEDDGCQRWASYDWLDDTVRTTVPNFDLPAASEHIKEVLSNVERNFFSEAT